MREYRRQSPLRLTGNPVKTTVRDGWEIVLEYENEANGPFLIDLSHIPKWDVQGSNLADVRPLGLTVPERPGDCRVDDGMLICRMNPVQALIWDLLMKKPGTPTPDHLTEVTDAFSLLALLGDDLLPVMEKVTAVDLFSPTQKTPFFVQGPVLRIPCRVAVLPERDGLYAILIGYARGYGQSFYEAFLDAALDTSIQPAGETRFRHWLEGSPAAS